MQITKEQLGILEKFSCERLSQNQEHKDLLKNFKSEKGSLLVDYLNAKAWEEDEKGITAYYLVKAPDNQVVMFFSLKCGALFDPLDEVGMKQRVVTAKELLQAIQNVNKDGDEKLSAIQLLEQYRTGQDISFTEIQRVVKNGAKANQILNLLNYDREREGNKQIIRVGHTYPSIELVHFCTNDNAKAFWKECSLGHPMGEVLFWRYVAPIIYEVQNQIGCQYTFLFAADTSEDGTLINYYNVSLKFEQPNNVGTSKPSYDFCCEFMCQEISNLKKNRQEYFDNFNPDYDDVIA